MKVISFGEIMLRLAPENNLRLMQESRLQATYGGSEANVAILLAQLGEKSVYVTKLPDNKVADGAVRTLRSFGVDTTFIARGGERMGIYFLERGFSVRDSSVVYDRKGSAIAEASPADFDWNEIMREADFFHFSGITPCLSPALSEITLAALKAARAAGTKVSFDLNYRKNLLGVDEAKKIILPLMDYVDICICNEEHARMIFDIDCGGDTALLARRVSERFSLKTTAVTVRRTVSSSVNEWNAVLFSLGEVCATKKLSLLIADKVGAGDSFAAGLIYALGNGFATQRAVNFAAAACALQHTVDGDFCRTDLAELEALAAKLSV